MRQKPAMICKLYHLHLHLSPFGILNDIVVFVINTTHVYHAVFKNSCHLLANRKDPSRDLVCFYTGHYVGKYPLCLIYTFHIDLS